MNLNISVTHCFGAIGRILAQFAVVLHPERIRTPSTALRSFPEELKLRKKWINRVRNIVPVLDPCGIARLRSDGVFLKILHSSALRASVFFIVKTRVLL